MKKEFVRFTYLFAIVVLAAGFLAFVTPQDHKTGGPWEIPAKYKEMKNPYASDKSLAKIGRGLYTKHCRACHGSKGLGNGTKAASLATFPGDFTTDAFKKTAEGVLYYQAMIGRDEMPNFEKKIPDDEDRWAIIMYILSLK